MAPNHSIYLLMLISFSALVLEFFYVIGDYIKTFVSTRLKSSWICLLNEFAFNVEVNKSDKFKKYVKEIFNQVVF